MFHEVRGANGATRRYKAYRITRDGFALLVMGFTGAKAMAWKIRFLEAFNAMEATLKAQAVAQIEAMRATAALPPPEPAGLVRAAYERREAIRRHADALLALVRAEVPEGHNRLSVTLDSNWGPDPALNTNLTISATSARTVWKADRRLSDGGWFFIDDAHVWEPGRRKGRTG